MPSNGTAPSGLGLGFKLKTAGQRANELYLTLLDAEKGTRVLKGRGQ